jgi:hypothetical protein
VWFLTRVLTASSGNANLLGWERWVVVTRGDSSDMFLSFFLGDVGNRRRARSCVWWQACQSARWELFPAGTAFPIIFYSADSIANTF